MTRRTNLSHGLSDGVAASEECTLASDQQAFCEQARALSVQLAAQLSKSKTSLAVLSGLPVHNLTLAYAQTRPGNGVDTIRRSFTPNWQSCKPEYRPPNNYDLVSGNHCILAQECTSLRLSYPRGWRESFQQQFWCCTQVFKPASKLRLLMPSQVRVNAPRPPYWQVQPGVTTKMIAETLFMVCPPACSCRVAVLAIDSTGC